MNQKPKRGGGKTGVSNNTGKKLVKITSLYSTSSHHLWITISDSSDLFFSFLVSSSSSCSSSSFFSSFLFRHLHLSFFSSVPCTLESDGTTACGPCSLSSYNRSSSSIPSRSDCTCLAPPVPQRPLAPSLNTSICHASNSAACLLCALSHHDPFEQQSTARGR